MYGGEHTTSRTSDATTHLLYTPPLSPSFPAPEAIYSPGKFEQNFPWRPALLLAFSFATDRPTGLAIEKLAEALSREARPKQR